MYQAFVLGLGALLLFGTGYFIKHTDSEGVLRSSLSTTLNASSSDTTDTRETESSDGVYVCDSSSGCQNGYTLTLSENGDATMRTSFENGVEVVDEFGVWQATGVMVTITFTGTAQDIYVSPRVLVGTLNPKGSFSRIEADKTLYPDFSTGRFTKQLKD